MTATREDHIAGLDFGSNSLRLSVARLDSKRGLEIVHREREALRLATDAFHLGELRDETIEALVAAATGFSQVMDSYRLGRYRAVGTEAFRRTSNAAQAVDLIGLMSGIQLEIITAAEEAELVLQAVHFSAPEEDDPALVVDLGGGSLEVITPGREGGQPGIESHALGLAASFEKFLQSQNAPNLDTRRNLGQLAIDIGRKLDSELLDSIPAGGTAVYVGGQAAMLDHLAVGWRLWKEKQSTGAGITTEAFERLLETVIETGPEELVMLGIPWDRAPMLAGAAAFYLTLAERIGAETIRLPRTGLMQGVLYTVPLRGQPWPGKTGH